MIIIYINEAHAADVWNIGESAGAINYSHKTIDDRIKYINKFTNEYSVTIPIYADNMNNDFETQFASWPVRFFVTKGTRIECIAMPEDSEIDVTQLFDYLSKE
jgi:hypothetical protein